WCQDLPGDDRTRDVGSIFRDLLDHAVPEQFAFFIPSAVSQGIRDILHEASHHVPARSCQRRVGIGRDYTIDPQFLGNLSELRDVVTALCEFKRRHEGEKGPLLRVEVRRSASEAWLLR